MVIAGMEKLVQTLRKKIEGVSELFTLDACRRGGMKYTFYTIEEAAMAQIKGVPATEFSRNFARYREEAIADKVIHVTSHGRVIGAYLSAAEAEHYERLKRRERQSLVVGALPDDVVAAIEAAEYGVEPE
jgi:hypothetical protein